MTDTDSGTQVPGGFVAPDAKDLVAPATAMLQTWQLLPSGSADDVSAVKGTPDSVAVIKSGMSAAAKWWSAAGVGSATLAAALTAWDKIPKPLQDGAGIGIPVFASAVVLGVAYIVANDVRGRAEATNEQLRSRAAVLQAYFALLGATHDDAVITGATAGSSTSGLTDAQLRSLVVAIAAGSEHQLTATGDGSTGALGTLRQLDGRPAQVRVGTDWVDVADVTDVHPTG
ncbi:hypothetical protein GCM10027446_03380 [Angustibacter peucedani]